MKSLLKSAHRLYQKAKRWLRYRLNKRHRYHLVDTGLEPGYYDPDTRMLYACFALLVYHVEGELFGCFANWKDAPHYNTPLEYLEARTQRMRSNPDPNAPEGLCEAQSDSEDEVLSLYRWWTIERPANRAREEEWLMRLYSGPMITQPVQIGNETLHQFMGVDDQDLSMGDSREFHAFRQQLEEDDQRNLHRLMDIRRSLWI